MDKQRMIFDIDKRTVTEGDIVEIHWQCPEAEQVRLTIDNGYRSTDIPLTPDGNKRFRLNRSKGKTHLIITVTINGKEYHKTIDVRVKKLPSTKAETIDNQGRRLGILRQWRDKLVSQCRGWRAKLKYSLSLLPPQKQLAVKLLAVMGLILILSAVWPRVYSIALAILVLYLAVVLFKKE